MEEDKILNNHAEGEKGINGSKPDTHEQKCEVKVLNVGEEKGQEEEKFIPSNNEEDDEFDFKDKQCGWFGCRPRWLQGCTNMKVLTLVLSFLSIAENMNYSYYSAVITQIEKQFGLSSAMTGFLKNVDNIGYMLTILLVSHFCRYSNKPILFSVATLLTALAIFLFAVPHFLYGWSNTENQYLDLNGTRVKKIPHYDLCDGNGKGQEDKCGRDGQQHLFQFNMGALTIFIVSELLQGMTQSPKSTLPVTYIDDNAKRKSPNYYGFLVSMRAVAPFVGFMLGAWCTSLYVDLEDTDLSPRDPRWVGAWWLGYVICAGCTLIMALPLSLFPPIIKGNKGSTGYQKKVDKETTVKDLKDLPSALWRLLSNPIICCNMLGASTSVLLIGFATFMPKYLEMHFGMTASRASMLTGLMASLSYAIGPIVSGRIVSHFRMTVTRALAMVVAVHGISMIGYLLMMMLGCPQPQWRGHLTPDSTCSSHCGCDQDEFQPVCGSDGVNYYSPCYAGCTTLISTNGTDKIFSGCSCIEGGQATLGQCENQCGMLLPYLIIMGVTKFFSSMSAVPIMAVNMRAVGDKDKALSLALFGFVIMVVSFPAPMLFGLAIDYVCLISQSTCGIKGACLLYDSTRLRYILHGIPVGLKMTSTTIFTCAFLWSRYKDRQKAKKVQDMSEEEEKKTEF